MEGLLSPASSLTFLLICSVRSKPPTTVWGRWGAQCPEDILGMDTTLPYIMSTLTGGISETPWYNKSPLF